MIPRQNSGCHIEEWSMGVADRSKEACRRLLQEPGCEMVMITAGRWRWGGGRQGGKGWTWGVFDRRSRQDVGLGDREGTRSSPSPSAGAGGRLGLTGARGGAGCSVGTEASGSVESKCHQATQGPCRGRSWICESGRRADNTWGACGLLLVGLARERGRCGLGPRPSRAWGPVIPSCEGS